METRIFLILLILAGVATAMDIVTVVMYVDSLRYHRALLYGTNMLYYVFQNSIPLVFVFFLLALSGKIDSNRSGPRITVVTPWVMSIALILSTPITGWIFSFDSTGMYHRGEGIPALYAIALLYTLAGLAIFYKSRFRVPRETRLGIFLFLPFALSTMAIQFFFPDLLIQNLGISLSSLVVLLTVQDFGKYTDHATNLFNRNGLIAQLELLLEKKKNACVFLVSLDTANFIQIVLGPDSFSALEREITRKLPVPAREDRFAAITGQGRYILVAGGTDTINDIRDALVRMFSTPWLFQDRLLSVSARICEVQIPEDTTDISTLFQAHYELSRDNVRYPLNSIIPFSELALANTGRRQEISRAINHTLGSDGFSVVFQPIISVKTGHVYAAEALLRLTASTGKMIPPDEFIPVAELDGTIHRIGDYVVREACKFLRDLRERGFSLTLLEINLSPVQCLQPNLSGRLLSIVQEYNLEPRELCFEITETAANRSPAVMKRNLDSLVTSGFSIAVDDFGTGYSNISSLMDLPFRIVKLDRSLIEAMDRSENGRLGLEGVISMFRYLNTELVAEGVETKDQAEKLTTMNVDYIQGYYFSRPLPVSKFYEFMEAEVTSVPD